MKDIGKKLKAASAFIKHDVWRIRRSQLSPGKSFSLNIVRVLLLSIRGFDEDKCNLRASALTFYSLISIVPVVAMAFGIAQGFGLEKVLEEQLRSKLAGHEEIIVNVIQFSHSLLENTKGGLIAGIGLVVLFWAVLKMLGQIEDSFNDIWGVKEKRTIGRMFADYLSLMLICPFILVLSSGVTVFVATQVTMILDKFAILGSFSSIVFFLLELLPYTLMWGLFTFLYVFMPNTKVRFASGLLAGIITGTIFQIVQLGYVTFQVGVVKYNAIYGSFAALPLFLVWLQLSWLIVLYGAELAFAHQNVDTYEFEPDVLQASHRFKTLLALQITAHLIKNFIKGERPVTAREISNKMEIPLRFVNEIIFELNKSNIISASEIEGDGDHGYQPAIDINVLTIQYVINAMEKRGINEMPFTSNTEFAHLSDSMDAFGKKIEQLPDNKLLKEL
jgi:membrane protein